MYFTINIVGIMLKNEHPINWMIKGKEWKKKGWKREGVNFCTPQIDGE
jgi:hypothetical protein